MGDGFLFVSIAFGSLLFTLAVGCVVYGIYWLSTKRVKAVSVAEKFKDNG